MHQSSPFFAFGVVKLNESAESIVLGQQDSAFFKGLSDRSNSVGFAVFVSRRILGWGDLPVVEGSKIATGKDVC